MMVRVLRETKVKHSKVVLTIFSIFTILMVLCSFGCPQEIPYEEPVDIEIAPENGGWNIKEHATYEMKVGESIVVYSEGLSSDDYRLFDENGEIYRGTALEWSKDEAGYNRVLTAKKAGEVTLKIEVVGKNEGEEPTVYACNITVVNVENSSTEEKIDVLLVGIWKSEKNERSSILFNADGSGRIVVYDLDEAVVNSSFNYVTADIVDEEEHVINILSIRDSNDEMINVDYSIQIEKNMDSELQLKIYGKIPGLPSPSTWTKK